MEKTLKVQCPDCGEWLILTPDNNNSDKGLVLSGNKETNQFSLAKRYECSNGHEYYVTIK